MSLIVFPGDGGGRVVVRRLPRRPFLQALRCSSSASSPDTDTDTDTDTAETPTKPLPFFPKRGQTLELVCESLSFKGKGVCKAADTGFVLMCDHALPGERFLGRVSRKKGNYAEVTKLKTIISPHWNCVEAPCEYAADCGGCKTQNLLYEAQVRAKEQQVHDRIIHVGRLSIKDTTIFKPIVPCDIQFRYRNKMEFSFHARRWVPDTVVKEQVLVEKSYSLGLHAPGFF